MKTKLELYLLDKCDRCTRIKYALAWEEIKYEEVNCTSSESSKCDSLEDKLDCGRYPMAVLKNSISTTIIHFCDNKTTTNSNTSRRIPVDSEDKFINEIKKYYI
jgi:hypothetical protein